MIFAEKYNAYNALREMRQPHLSRKVLLSASFYCFITHKVCNISVSYHTFISAVSLLSEANFSLLDLTLCTQEQTKRVSHCLLV